MNLMQNALLQGGKYRIEKVLGQGGFGITYLAVQVGLNRKVAIKEFFMKDCCERDAETSHVTIPTSNNRDLVARFRQKFIKEAQTIAGLNHPHIIRIHDIFEENGTAYYVMEYHNHGSLSELIKQRGSLPEAEALRYIREVADALAYIHEHQMNHLDVKPGNVLLDEKGRSVLIDFGLSKRYDESGHQTSTTPVGISHGYAPMEQYKQGGVGTFSPATDIYSLGATFYKLLTGKTPPDASDVNDDGLPELPSSVSASTRTVVVVAMQPRRKDRPQSVAAFLALLDKEPVVADIDDDDEDTVIEIEPESKPKPQPQPAPKPAPQPTLAPSRNKWLVPTLIAAIVALIIIFWPKGGSEEPVLPTAYAPTVASVVVEDSMPLAPVKEEVPVMSSLYVTTSPVGATVKVDGKTIGKSPIEGKELVAGKHTIQITLDGYENISEKLTFTHKPMILNKTLQAKQVKAVANATASVSSPTTVNKQTFTVNGVNFTMIHVVGGTFQMGSDDSDAYDDEKPVHSVTLSSYSIGETEVTQALWTAVMGSNPSNFKGNNLPVEKVSWNDCQTFIRKLNSLTGENFRLPTEAEWEFAARGGNRSRGYKYSGSDNLSDVAWYSNNSGNKTHAVKTKSPNELGIYDMSGNVWEWCSDYYGRYSSSSVTNPKGPSSGSNRVIRGGSWNFNASYCCVAYRYSSTPSNTFGNLGLRLAL